MIALYLLSAFMLGLILARSILSDLKEDRDPKYVHSYFVRPPVNFFRIMNAILLALFPIVNTVVLIVMLIYRLIYFAATILGTPVIKRLR